MSISAVHTETPVTDQPEAAAGPDAIDEMRARIDAVDAELVRLWQERAELSRRIGAARMAAGGTRLVLSREQQIIQKFYAELGPIGTQLAMLLLRAGRGAL